MRSSGAGGREQALRITRERRPEMLKTAPLDKKDRLFLKTLEEKEE